MFDRHMKILKISCYLSFDIQIHFNSNCDVFSVNKDCVDSPIIRNKSTEPQAFTEVEVEKMLSFIPRDLKNRDRYPINLAVLAILKHSGISLLESHWTTPKRDKLKNDLLIQLKKIEGGKWEGGIEFLVDRVKQYGWDLHTTRSKRLRSMKSVAAMEFRLGNR